MKCQQSYGGIGHVDNRSTYPWKVAAVVANFVEYEPPELTLVEQDAEQVGQLAEQRAHEYVYPVLDRGARATVGPPHPASDALDCDRLATEVTGLTLNLPTCVA